MLTSDAQVQFLTNFQRLLAEGSFVATYKFALLLALADLSVEKGDDIGSSIEIATMEIAEKFIELYWRQATPFVPKDLVVEHAVLVQSTGKQASIVTHIERTRAKTGDSIVRLKSQKANWDVLVRKVDRTLRDMPLWKLQTVGNASFDFLYPNVGRGSFITLRPGIATCFRKFHGLVGDIVRGAWVRFIRRHNHHLLGTTTDLAEFMFGSERAQLNAVRQALRESGPNRCFYCDGDLTPKSTQVDHFIPWSRYPIDLGHNFVLAHQSCNLSKSDHIAAVEYLEKWVDEVGGTQPYT